MRALLLGVLTALLSTLASAAAAEPASAPARAAAARPAVSPSLVAFAKRCEEERGTPAEKRAEAARKAGEADDDAKIDGAAPAPVRAADRKRSLPWETLCGTERTDGD